MSEEKKLKGIPPTGNAPECPDLESMMRTYGNDRRIPTGKGQQIAKTHGLQSRQMNDQSNEPGAEAKKPGHSRRQR